MHAGERLVFEVNGKRGHWDYSLASFFRFSRDKRAAIVSAMSTRDRARVHGGGDPENDQMLALLRGPSDVSSTAILNVLTLYAKGTGECPICLEKYKGLDGVVVSLSCGHGGCAYCMELHALSGNKCHLCREPLEGQLFYLSPRDIERANALL
jgi:hypothetical protein